MGTDRWGEAGYSGLRNGMGTKGGDWLMAEGEMESKMG